MEQIYNEYKDVADFRMIYIREAHAADGPRPMGVGKTLGIKEHTNYSERCQTAEMLINDRSLTMPMLIDDMKNTANLAYQAHPDRVFLVRTDGRLAVAAERGPWGFSPGLKATEQWLTEFKKTGKEPELPKAAAKKETNPANEKSDEEGSSQRRSNERRSGTKGKPDRQ